MIDINRKYRYRNGKEARILCTDLIERGEHCVVSSDNEGHLFTHTIRGHYMLDREHGYDLVEVKEKKIVRMAPPLVYFNGKHRVTDLLFSNEGEAREEYRDAFIKWLIDTPYALDVEVIDD